MFKATTSLILIIASVLIGVFYARPLYEKMQTTRSNIADVEEALQNTEEIIDLVRELGAQVRSLTESERSRLEAILPPDVDEVRLLNMLNSFASQRGVTFSGMKVSGGEEGEEATEAGGGADTGIDAMPRTVEVSFSVEASYEKFKKLLTDLEKSLVIADVSSLSLSPVRGEDDGASDTYVYDITLITYWTKL